MNFFALLIRHPQSAIRSSLLLAICILSLACANSDVASKSAPASTTSIATESEQAKKTTDFNGERAFNHVKTQVEFGPRPAGSAALEKTREYLTLSKLELDRLSLLVDKVLRLSMFEETEPHLQPEPLDLGALALQVTAAMALQAERAGARIHTDGLKQHEFIVLGDRLHLSSVIFNLLDNAIKYTSGTPDIHIAIEKTPEIVRLCVRDNGIGIPPDYQDKVFEKFFRVPSGGTHNVKGHGLGLSYVSRVVRQHGGDIRLESIPGRGSAFVVELPATKLPAEHSDFVGSDQTF